MIFLITILIKNKKTTIMAKFELVEKTEVNGEVWYYIRKEGGLSLEGSWSKNLEVVQKMLEELEKGKPSEPIFKVLKTIEINED